MHLVLVRKIGKYGKEAQRELVQGNYYTHTCSEGALISCYNSELKVNHRKDLAVHSNNHSFERQQ